MPRLVRFRARGTREKVTRIGAGSHQAASIGVSETADGSLRRQMILPRGGLPFANGLFHACDAHAGEFRKDTSVDFRQYWYVHALCMNPAGKNELGGDG